MSSDHQEIELLKEEYLSQIRGAFPLYRAVLLFVALVIIVAVQNSKFKSVTEGLLNLRLRLFADLDKGFFASITVQDALIAVGMLLVGASLHRLVRWLFFVWIKKRLRLDEITRKMNEKSAQAKGGTVDNYFALKRSESEAKIWSKKVASLSLISESAATLFITFVYAGFFGNVIDFGVAFACLLYAIFALALSFIVFLKNYLPHATHTRGLLGLSSDVALP